MPAVIEVTAGVPAGSRGAVSHLDVHRLACYLLEPPAAREHRLQDKPFSVWPPLEVAAHGGGHLGGMDVVSLRLNWLAASPPPLGSLQDRLANTPHLGEGVPLTPLELSVDEVRFAELCAWEPARACEVSFLSPTLFSRNGRRYPLPDPVLVMQSLGRRWNVLAGGVNPALCIEEDDLRALLSAIVVERCDITTAVTRSPVEQVGFLGEVAFALLPAASRMSAAVFASLWRFAELAGVGRSTTYGLGAVEVEFP